MQNLYDKIEKLDLKIRQVVQKMELLRKENMKLIEENSRLKKEKSYYLDKIDELGKKQASLEPEVNIPSISNSVELGKIKTQLVEYIDEIDTCIELLKN